MDLVQLFVTDLIKVIKFLFFVTVNKTTNLTLVQIEIILQGAISNYGCHGNKTEKIWKTSKIFLSETIRVRATKFGM